MPRAAGLRHEWHGPEDAPVVVLSAGLGGLGSYWTPNRPALSARFRVLTYDQRGTGGSEDETRAALSVENMAADLLALMDALGIARASLVGHALGAHIGLALGLAAPERLDRLVAINAWPRLDPLTERCFDARLALLRDSGPEAFFRAQPLFLYPGTWVSEHDATLRAEAAAHLAHFRGAETILRRVAALRAFDPLSRLAAFRAPVLALCAKDDLLVPWTASQALAEALPAAELEVLPWAATPATSPIRGRSTASSARGSPPRPEPTGGLKMQVGVFVPINNNGWLISEAAPQYKPSFDLNKEIAIRAERYGLDFLLSMIKLRGFGGKTEFWEYGLESFTLMAGLAAVTERIKIYATCATLLVPPAYAARMASTIDSISHGRFGLNLITGWQRPEYSQMGMWPGDEHFKNRYQMLDEYAHILRELWASGESDFKGRYYRMDDCRVRPAPQGEMKIICAGSSDEGLAFSAKWADYAFCLGKGVNTPKAFAFNNERLAGALAKTGRRVSVFVLVMVIAAETDEEATAKWRSYNDGVDHAAIAWLADQGAVDKHNATTNVRQLAAPEGAVNINMGTLVGSYASVARMLDEMAEVPNTGGVLLTFDDFVQGVEAFGTRIQPLMKSRAGAARAAA